MSQAPQSSAIDVGTLVADTYRVIRLIGRGGMGAVWQAEHTRLPGKRVAIKILHADVAMEPDSVARFRREAEITSRLGHPNIVGILDFNSLPGGKPYLVLDFLEGESLELRIERGPMPLDDALDIVRQVGSALRAAHRADIIHRDLKPANVFLTRAGPDSADEIAKVLDFGISKIRGSQTLKTQDSTILGTPQYMAPEQAVGNHDAVNGTTDVFALGAMTYEMLAGRPAFVGQTIPEVVFKVVYEEPVPITQLLPTLPPRVSGSIHRALAKQQDQRFPSVDAFVEAITGEPLVTARRRRASLHPGRVSTPRDSAAATADTMAHGARPVAVATADTMASGGHPAMAPDGGAPSGARTAPHPGAQLATADTLDSGRGHNRAPLADPTAATVASGAHPPVLPQGGSVRTIPQPVDSAPTMPDVAGAAQPAADRPGNRSPVLVFVIAAAVLGAGGAAFGMWKLGAGQSGEATGSVASEPTLRHEGATPTPLNASAPTAVEPTATPDSADAATGGVPAAADAGVQTATERPAQDRDPATRDTRPAADTRAAATSESTGGRPHANLSEQARADLAAATNALAGGQADRALRLARRALRNGGGARAQAILARAHCHKQDLSNARAAYRGLPRRAKRAVARYCARYDIDLK